MKRRALIVLTALDASICIGNVGVLVANGLWWHSLLTASVAGLAAGASAAGVAYRLMANKNIMFWEREAFAWQRIASDWRGIVFDLNPEAAQIVDRNLEKREKRLH